MTLATQIFLPPDVPISIYQITLTSFLTAMTSYPVMPTILILLSLSSANLATTSGSRKDLMTFDVKEDYLTVLDSLPYHENAIN